MPRIPVNRQGQVISGGSPVQAVSPSGAGETGSLLAQTGSSLERFGSSLARYRQRKQAVDDAQIKAQARAQATLVGQKARQKALINPNAKKDGSDLQENFVSGFNPEFTEFVEGLGNDRHKSLAIQEANKVQLKFRSELRDIEIEKHNASILDGQNELKNKLSLAVQNDPSTLIDALKTYDETIVELPFAEGENGKIQREGKKDILLGAIEGLTEKGAFDTIREGLNNPEISSLLRPGERRELLKALEDEQTEFENNKWRTETRKQIQLEVRRKEDARNLRMKLTESIINAETPEERQEANRLASIYAKRGVFDIRDFNAITSFSEDVSEDISTEERANFTIRYLNGESFDKLEKEIISATGKTLTHKDSLSLLKDLEAREKREATLPGYKEEKDIADDLIKSAVDPIGFSSNGQALFGKDQKLAVSNMRIRAKELEDNGVSPLKAARIAIGEVVGRGSSLFIPGVDSVSQNDPKSLSKLAARIARNYKIKQEKGELSPEIKAEVRQKLRLIKEKIKALEAQRQMNEILNNDTKLKEKVNGTGE